MIGLLRSLAVGAVALLLLPAAAQAYRTSQAISVFSNDADSTAPHGMEQIKIRYESVARKSLPGPPVQFDATIIDGGERAYNRVGEKIRIVVPATDLCHVIVPRKGAKEGWITGYFLTLKDRSPVLVNGMRFLRRTGGWSQYRNLNRVRYQTVRLGPVRMPAD